MKRYLIERDLPGVGRVDSGRLAAAATSNDVLARRAGTIIDPITR